MAHYEDRFCRQWPWSNFIREVGSGGGGGQLRQPRDLLIPALISRKIFYIEQRFFTSAV